MLWSNFVLAHQILIITQYRLLDQVLAMNLSKMWSPCPSIDDNYIWSWYMHIEELYHTFEIQYIAPMHITNPPMHRMLMSSLVEHALTSFIPNDTCSNHRLTTHHVHGHVNSHISIPHVLSCIVLEEMALCKFYFLSKK